jgi:hypothetical protein
VTLSTAPVNPRGVDLSQRDEIQARINAALTAATRVDTETAAALRNFTAAAAGLLPSPTDATVVAAALPPPGTSPMDVKKWLSSSVALESVWPRRLN